MTIAVNESSRPPYVVFQSRAVEDRKATMETGKYTAKTEDWAVIRQAGDKDSAECEATAWLERIAKNPGYKPEWVEGYRRQFKEWKQGHEPSLNGTSIRLWPAISPGQAETLNAMAVMTVEDLAAANDTVLQRIGMGAQDLKRKARAWLDSATKVGITAEELASLRVQNELLLEQNNELRTLLLQMRATQSLPAAPAAEDVDPFK
jgi:hypothetical protein